MKLLLITVTLFTFLVIIQINAGFVGFQFSEAERQLPGNTGIAGNVIEKRIIDEIQALKRDGLFFLSPIEQNKREQNLYVAPDHSYDNWKQRAQFAIKNYKQNTSYGVREAVSELQGTLDLLENALGK